MEFTCSEAGVPERPLVLAVGGGRVGDWSGGEGEGRLLLRGWTRGGIGGRGWSRLRSDGQTQAELAGQGHFLAGGHRLVRVLEVLPKRTLVAPGHRFEDLLFHVVEVLDNVARQLVFGADQHFDDLVKVEGLDGEDLEDPGEDALRVVREEDNLEAAGEQEAVKHILLKNSGEVGAGL